jgi:hypothetical protein
MNWWRKHWAFLVLGIALFIYFLFVTVVYF